MSVNEWVPNGFGTMRMDSLQQGTLGVVNDPRLVPIYICTSSSGLLEVPEHTHLLALVLMPATVSFYVPLRHQSLLSNAKTTSGLKIAGMQTALTVWPS